MLPLVTLLVTLNMANLAQAQARYSYSADGSEVTDAQTGLVWRRCSQGQDWSAGTCIGSATIHTHEQALTLAKAQTGWRLPNAKELSSLVDRSRVNPSIDVTRFPATPSEFYWTSTPYAGDASNAWNVYFYNGALGVHHLGYNGPHVRLVR